MAPGPELPPISPLAFRLYARVVRRCLRRHFSAVRTQRSEALPRGAGPLVVYANHSSWWDPMLGVLLARMLLPGRRHYAPMDADALRRYPMLGKVGVFPVETHSRQNARKFVETAEAILRSGGVLWVTPQGRFADVREFPLAFRPGLAALATRVPEATLLPLAMEYTFWDNRLPEALCRFGEPQSVQAGATVEQTTRALEKALSATMLELQQASCQRDGTLFRTLLEGRRRNAYGMLRWLRRTA
jgi:1-acyl-sn-glycerol-3-phosphate acyltransferase